jgi:hypothetical protein
LGSLYMDGDSESASESKSGSELSESEPEDHRHEEDTPTTENPALTVPTATLYKVSVLELRWEHALVTCVVRSRFHCRFHNYVCIRVRCIYTLIVVLPGLSGEGERRDPRQAKVRKVHGGVSRRKGFGECCMQLDIRQSR